MNVGIGVKDAPYSLETKSPLKVCLLGVLPLLFLPRAPVEHRGAVSREAASVGCWGGAAGHPATAQEKTRQRRQYRLSFLIHLPASQQSSSPENTCSSIFEQRLMVDAARHVDSGYRHPPGTESHFSALEKTKRKKRVLKVVTVSPRKEDLTHIMTFVDASGDKAAQSNGCVQRGGRRNPSFRTFGNNNI